VKKMRKTTSRDGTSIAFDLLGNGPAIILVGGASTDRSENSPLAALLEKNFTVFNYDRSGRGDSGDTAAYAVTREIEDIEALIDEAGGGAFVVGFSSGAVLALKAAIHGLQIQKMTLFEPPLIVDGSQPRPPADLASRYKQMIAAGRRGDAVEFFMTKVVSLPVEFAAQARNSAGWSAQEAMAHTLAYDATIMGDFSLPIEQVKDVSAPMLVIAGEASFQFMRATAQALADALPDEQVCILDGQTRDVAPQVLAPVLEDFFLG
jgi:pimeloyl-ACP methyl ester carboxylesterase